MYVFSNKDFGCSIFVLYGYKKSLNSTLNCSEGPWRIQLGQTLDGWEQDSCQ